MTKVISRMQEITIEINSKLDVIQKESVSVGSLLKEALQCLKDEGKKQADFLEYCKNEFSIGKAQAYKLMKVAEVFEDDARFKGVAMRVLYTLATTATDEQMEKAAEFAASGTLNTAVVNQLLYPEAPQAPAPTPAPETTEEAEEKQEEANQSLNNLPEVADLPKQEQEDDIPFDMGDAPAAPATSVEAQMTKHDAMQEANVSGLESEISELRAALEAANELIKSLQADKVTAKPAAPMLPQFKNACYYARLGLGQIEARDAAKVRKAFRELIKCGYGDGHDAFKLLTEAKDALLEEIKAAK